MCMNYVLAGSCSSFCDKFNANISCINMFVLLINQANYEFVEEFEFIQPVHVFVHNNVITFLIC